MTGELALGLGLVFSTTPVLQIPSPWIGEYTCVTDDITEVTDGETFPGHRTMDLDGDQSDPPAMFEGRVDARGISLQTVLVNKTTSNWRRFELVKSVDEKGNRSLIAYSSKDMAGRTEILVLLGDPKSRNVGLTHTTNSYSTPLMRQGETFVTVDVRLARCRKR